MPATPTSPPAGARPGVPPEGEPGKAGLPKYNPTEDPFASLVVRVSEDALFLDQARMGKDVREAAVRKRREDENDTTTSSARKTAGFFSGEADEAKINITLPAVRELFGLTDTDPQSFTRTELAGRCRGQLEDLRSGGSHSIFAPASTIDRTTGEQRIAGEKHFVAAQVFLTELALQQAGAQDYAGAVSACQGIYPSLADAPGWFLAPLTDSVQRAAVNTGNRNGLRALNDLASLVPAPDRDRLTSAAPESLIGLDIIYRAALDGSVEWKKVEAEEKAREKKEKHDGRLKTLTEDTYSAAVTGGRREFGRLREATDSKFTSAVVPLPDRGDDRYLIPFNVIETNRVFQETINQHYNNIERLPVNSPGRQLRNLAILVENPRAYQAVVDDLAANMTVDWTGYTRADYQDDPTQWRNYWDINLRTMIDGYALGMLQGAVEAQVPDMSRISEWDRSNVISRFEQMTTETIGLSLQVMFGDRNMLVAADISSMTPQQLEIRRRFGEYFKRLTTEPTDHEQAARLKKFLEGTGVGDAVAVVKGRQERARAAEAARIERDRKISESVVAESDKIRASLAGIETGVLVDLSSEEAFQGQLRGIEQRLLNGEQTLKGFIVISSDGPKVSVEPNYSARLTQEQKKAQALFEEERSKGEKADPRKLQSLGHNAALIQADIAFVERVVKYCDEEINNYRRTDSKSLGRSVTLFRSHIINQQPYDTFSPLHYEKVEGWDKRKKSLIDGEAEGSISLKGLRKRYEDLQAEYLRPQGSQQRRANTEILRDMQKLTEQIGGQQREIASFVSRIRTLHPNELRYLADYVGYNLVRPALEKKNLISENY